MAQGWEAGDYLDRPLRELLADTAGDDPVPAAGSTIAATATLAAALTAKVARRSRRDDADELAARADTLRERLEHGITLDAAAYADLLATAPAERDRHSASHWPALVADVTSQIATLADGLAAAGNPNLRYDAEAAARLARAAGDVAELLVRANDG